MWILNYIFWGSLCLNSYPFISHIGLTVTFFVLICSLRNIEKRFINFVFVILIPLIYTLTVDVFYYNDIGYVYLYKYIFLFFIPLVGVYLYIRNIGVLSFANRYYNFIWICSIVGLIQFICGFLNFQYLYDFRFLGMQITNVDFINDNFLRVYSIFREPSILPIYFTPITLLIIDNIVNKTKNICSDKTKNILIIACLLLTFSLVAYVNILFCFIFCLLKGKINFRKFASIFVIFIGISSIASIGIVSDKLNGFINNDSQSSGSSFAVISNYEVVAKKLNDNAFIGPGFTNYNKVYDKYITSVAPKLYMNKELNRDDASNLYFRLLGEYGILFFMLLLLLMTFQFIKNYNYFGWVFFVSLLLYGLRYGSYTEIVLYIYLSSFIYATKENTFNNTKTI